MQNKLALDSADLFTVGADPKYIAVYTLVVSSMAIV